MYGLESAPAAEATPATAGGEGIRKLIVGGLAAYIFLVTVVFTIATENTAIIKASLGQTIIFGLTCLWFARLVHLGDFKFIPAEFNVPLLGLLLGCVLSLILSPFKYYSLMEIAHFVSYFLSVWLIYNNVRTRGEFMLLLWIFIVATIVAIVYAFLQRAGYDPIDWGMAIFMGTLCSPNLFSAFMMLALPTMLGFCFASSSWLVRLGVGLWLGLGIWGVVIVKSYSAWYGGIIAIIVFLCLQLLWGGWTSQLRNWPRNIFIVGVLALITFWGLVAYDMAGHANVLAVPFKLGYGVEGGTNQVRLVMWMGAAKMWAEQPFFGQGIGTFRLMFPRFRPSYYHRWGVSHNTDYPHNEYFGIAADQGLLGLALFGWFWWTVAFSFGHAIRREGDWLWRQLLIGLLCAFIANMGDNLMSPYMRWASTGVAAYFVVGLGFAAMRLAQNNLPSPQPAGNNSLLKYPVYLLLAVVFVFAAFVEWRVFFGEALMKLGEGSLNRAGATPNENNRQEWETAKARFEEALISNPYNHSALYKLAYINLQMGKPADALAIYEKLMALAPHYAQIHYNVGLVYQLMGSNPDDPQRTVRPLQSLEQFALATRIEDYPHNQTLTGSTLMHLGEYRRAPGHFARIAEPALFDWQREFYRAMDNPCRAQRGLASENGFLPRARVIYARALSLTGTAYGMSPSANDRKLQSYYYRRALIWHPYESEVMMQLIEKARAEGNTLAYAERLAAVIGNITKAELSDNMVRNNFVTVLNLVVRHVNDNQRNDKFWDLLAVGQMKLGDLLKARQCAQNALEINSGNVLAREHMREIERLSAPAGSAEGNATTVRRPGSGFIN